MLWYVNMNVDPPLPQQQQKKSMLESIINYYIESNKHS